MEGVGSNNGKELGAAWVRVDVIFEKSECSNLEIKACGFCESMEVAISG